MNPPAIRHLLLRLRYTDHLREPSDLYDLGISRLWAETRGDPSVSVAVLDGPVDVSHPCFDGARLTQIDPGGTASTPCKTGPSARHGTNIASVIFGQHGSPVTGIAPECRGIVIPIFRDGRNDSIAPCSQLDLARGITSAVEMGANVINISGGQFEPSGEPHHFLERAVRYCIDHDVLVVAAIGNEGCEYLQIPAALRPVLAVGSMDRHGNPPACVKWPRAYQTHGVLAPGEDISGAIPGDGVMFASGTSVSTAIVSGVAGLLLSLQTRLGQKPSGRTVRSTILGTAGRNNGPRTGVRQFAPGRLDIEAARIRTIDRTGGAVMTSPDDLDTVAPDQHDAGKTTSETGLPDSTSRPAVTPATCGCGQGGGGCKCNAAPQVVFALGQLGFDYVTEARRDSIAQHMGGDPGNPELLLAYLDKNPWDAASICWTLSLDAVRIYAIQGDGAFASQVYERLRGFLRAQLTEGVERISVPGRITGQRRLLTGEVVPVISAELRGMYSWTTSALVQAVSGSKGEKETHDGVSGGVRNFLERVYHELRNLGMTAQERAINYAATNAFAANEIFESALKEKMELDAIEVVRSPICRPDSDCWDVKLTFFDPERAFQRARRTDRFTVDVSDVVPVTVGPVRRWFIR